MSSGLISHHPQLYLQEHIDQVLKAMRIILAQHSDQVASKVLLELTESVVLLHDLGKSTPAFQEYIKDPPHYRGEPEEKQHSGLSSFLAMLITRYRKWDELQALAVAVVILGHHSRLPIIPEDSFTSSPSTIESFTASRFLKDQLEGISFKFLAEEIRHPLILEAQNIELRLEGRNTIKEIKKYISDRLLKKFYSMDMNEAVSYRLFVQLVYSILLEADKAFLAIKTPATYNREYNRWEKEWVNLRIGNQKPEGANVLRKSIREELVRSMEKAKSHRVFCLTAPTGSGKTLLAATWALTLKETMEYNGRQPKVIIVLPFLSVIDQTATEYRRLLKCGGIESDGTWLLNYHSLADRNYSEHMGEEESPFLVDTWNSDVIITTYDQFLLSLMEPRAKYQMRFHNLCDAIIVFDEVQSLPCQLWSPLESILTCLAEEQNSRILLMSATLPPFINNATPLLENYREYFASFRRYKIVFRLGSEPTNINSFCSDVSDRLQQWLTEGKRVMITMNTRKSARMVLNALMDAKPYEHQNVPFFFISADVTPGDRLEKIEAIKKGKPCVVVSTQCIEAGVDIDMDLIIRDFGPLDSIIQIAGRCNREGNPSVRGIVEIVDIADEDNKRYSEMIYDDKHLYVTREVLNAISTDETADETVLLEEQILPLTARYFEGLSKRKETGEKHLEAFARWHECTPVKELLRGKEKRQFTFLVIEQDNTLFDEMKRAAAIEERWKRREEWKKLAGRMARISVNIFAKQGFYPNSVANECFNDIFILRDGYYRSETGLQVEGYPQIL